MLAILAIMVIGIIVAVVLVITATMLSSQMSSIEAEFLAKNAKRELESGSVDYPASENPLSPS